MADQIIQGAYNLHKLLQPCLQVHPQRGKLFPQYQSYHRSGYKFFLLSDILMMFMTSLVFILSTLTFINEDRCFQNSASHIRVITCGPTDYHIVRTKSCHDVQSSLQSMEPPSNDPLEYQTNLSRMQING